MPGEATLTTAPGRIVGIDIARGAAVLGMVIAHTLSQDSTTARILSDLATGERPRTIFALVGGISLALYVASSQRIPGISTAQIRRSVAVRGIAILALGLFLQTMMSGVSVVLDTWGLLFLLCVPLLWAPGRWLLALGALAFLLGSVLHTLSAGWDPLLLAPGHVLSQLLDWLVAGDYPLPLWAGYLSLGYVLARVGITTRSVRLWMLAAGTVVCITGYALKEYVLPDGSITGGLAVHLSALGFAATTVAALLTLTGTADGRGPGTVTRLARMLLWPLMAVGAMPLTIYTGQVIALALKLWLQPTAPLRSLGLWLTLTVVSLLFASLWRVVFGQGPLERLLGLLDGRPTRSATASVTSPAAVPSTAVSTPPRAHLTRRRP